MPTLMLAMLTPAEGREAEFNRWYDEVHAAEALSTPGLHSITRYKMSDLVLFPGTEISTQYLTIYELEDDRSETVERVATSLREVFLGGSDTDGRHISEIRFTDLIDMSDVAAGFAIEVSARRTQSDVLGATAN
jgi:hypothetical protein